MLPLNTYVADRPLDRDCKKALNSLFMREEHWSGFFSSSSAVTSQSLVEGEMTSFSRSIAAKSIPGGKTWRWNQSRGRTLLTHEDGSSISVAKLCPRKKPALRSRSANFDPIEDIPSHKLWMFELKDVRGGLPLTTVLWCQVGNRPPECVSASSPPPSPLLVQTESPWEHIVF